MTYNLTGLTVSSTYPRIVQVINGNEYYDGLGNPLNIGSGGGGSQGPTGPVGGPGPQGPTGPIGGVLNDFFSASNVTITHNLGFYPGVQVIDNNGEVVMPITISHSSTNSYFVDFGATISGYVITSAGVQGNQGFQGPTGPPNGPQGNQGPTGLIGNSGPTGDQGPTGPQGTTGSNLPFFFSNTAPTASSLTAGSRWFHSDTGVEYVYIDDGDSLQWVQPTSTIAGSLNYQTSQITSSSQSIVINSQYGPEYFGISSSVTTHLYLPTNIIVGKTITIKDESGKSSIHPIRIYASSGESIDNISDVQLAIDYGSLTMIRRNNNWWII